MSNPDFTLALMAEIGALRKFVLSAVALKLLDEPAPLDALTALGAHLCLEPTQPGNHGGMLDPAVSDLLAAETDDRVRALVGDLGQKLRGFMNAA